MNQNFENILSKRNHLLLIGIDQYKFCKRLENCVFDCNQLKSILLGEYNFENDKVTELSSDDAKVNCGFMRD